MVDRTILTRPFLRLVVANMLYWGSLDIFLPVLPQYYNSLGFSGFEVGMVVGAVSGGGLLFRVTAGKAVDRYGTVPLVTLGLILSVLAIGGYAIAKVLGLAVASAFLQGVGLACYSGAALTMATLMFPEQYVTDIFTVYTLFGMFGATLSMSGANWLYGIGGLPLIVAVGGGMAFISLLLFPKKPPIRVKIQKSASRPVKEIVKIPGVYIPTIGLLFTNLCFGGAMTFLPLLMLSRGVPDFNPFFIAHALTVIATRLSLRYILRLSWAERLAGWAVGCMGLMMLLAVVAYHWQLLSVCGVLMGISLGLAFPVMATTVTANTAPANRGAAFGFFSTAADIGFMIGSTGFGFAAAIWGYAPVFGVAGLYTVGYAVLYRLYLERRITPVPAAE